MIAISNWGTGRRHTPYYEAAIYFQASVTMPAMLSGKRMGGCIMPPTSPRMTADDYWGLPEGVRAELIDGELWDLAAPSRLHQGISMQLGIRFSTHIALHGGPCKVYAAPFAVNLFADDTTFVEPDLSVVCDGKKLSNRGCEGAPDLVVEIVSPSSRGMDYGTKQNLYREAGVREYWIVDPSVRRTMVTRFAEDPAPMMYPFEEPIPVGIYPGLAINLDEIVKGA